MDHTGNMRFYPYTSKPTIYVTNLSITECEYATNVWVIEYICKIIKIATKSQKSCITICGFTYSFVNKINRILNVVFSFIYFHH